MNTRVHFKNWTKQNKLALSGSKTFTELASIAIDVLKHFPDKVDMVSGPISTGGVGSIDGNRRVFERVVEILASENGLNVFSQMPFEDKMVELYRKWHEENPSAEYCLPILNDFYEPLFSLGRVKTLHFIDGWRSSFGARWEHDNCVRWGIERAYLPLEMSLRVLNGWTEP